jgi:hypothetical protein
VSTENLAGPGAGDDFAERLVIQLDRHAAGSRPEQDELAGDEPAGDEFDALADQLRAAATWAEPPGGLREQILAQIRAETPAALAAAPEPAPTPAATPEPAPAPAATPEPAPAPAKPGRVPAAPRWWSPAGWRVRWGRLAWAVPVTAMAAAAFTAGVLAVDRALQPDPPTGEVYAISGTELAPGASAEVSVRETGSGFSVVIDADRLPPAAPGSYYAAWLRGPQGTVPLGSFHKRQPGDPVELWSGVDPAGYPNFMVTLQAEGDPPAPSRLVVLTGSLTR